MKFFLIVFCILGPVGASAQLVTISSSYVNQLSPSSTVLVKGSGFLVEFNRRFFVFTASHVSQGENLSIQLNGQTLTPVGRALSEVNDAELIEVQGPLKADFEAKGVFLLVRQDSFQRKRWIDADNFVPLQDWIEDPNLDADNQISKTLSAQLNLDLFGISLHAPEFVQPGTSGSPLIVTINEKPSGTKFDYREWFETATIGKSYIRGLAIRRERFFAQASFVPASQLVLMLSNYLKKKSPQTQAKWKASGTVLYREMKESGMRETFVSSSSATGGIVTPIGNAVGMDGGDLKSSKEDSPKEFLSRVSSFPSVDGTPRTSWLFVQRSPVDNSMISFNSWFDMESYPYLSRFQLNLGGGSSSEVSYRLRSFPDFEKDGFSYVRTGDFMRIAIKLPGDSLEILLNKSGAVCESEANCSTGGFQPILEATSMQKKEAYIVDLRSLFFVDMSSALSGAFRNWSAAIGSDSNFDKLSTDNLIWEAEHIQVRFRKKAGVNRPLRNEEAKATILVFPKN